MTRITRVEVITDQGRDYVNWKDDNDITLSYQDNEKTLKIFVNTVKPKTGEEGALEALEEWLGPQGPVGPGPGPKGVIDGDWEEWLGEEPPEEQKLSPIEQTKKDIENLQNKLKLLEYQETVRTDVEKAYRDFYGHYPIIDMSTNDFDCVTWVAFKEGYKAGRKPKEYQPTSEKSEKEQQIKELVRESKKWCEENPEKSVEDYLTPQTPEQIEKSLREAFKKVQQTEEWKETQRKIDSNYEDKNFKNSLDLIKEWGEKNKPLTLYEILMDWWINHPDMMEQSDERIIDDLVNIIGEKFIPPSNDRNGYEWEKCLKMMRDKLR